MTIFDDPEPGRQSASIRFWTEAENPPVPDGDDELGRHDHKDQLVDYAAANGVEVSASAGPRPSIRAAIDGE